MLALVNGEPKILTLRECLDVYIAHREDVVIRRTKFELKKAEARAHILEGLKIALDNIDEVIQIIRNSYDDAKERLMERFRIIWNSSTINIGYEIKDIIWFAKRKNRRRI